MLEWCSNAIKEQMIQYLLVCTYPVNSNKMAARLPNGAITTCSGGDSASVSKLGKVVCGLANASWIALQMQLLCKRCTRHATSFTAGLTRLLLSTSEYCRLSLSLCMPVRRAA